MGFQIVSAPPAPELRGLVRAYADFEERAAHPVKRRELPGGELVLIVDLGAGWRITQAGRSERFGSFVGGLHDGPAVSEHDGWARCVQIDLTPLGARAVLGLPLSELAHRVVPLDALLGADAARLEQALHDARDARERFALLDRALARRAAAAAPASPDLAWAWRRLVETDGRIGVAALAGELGCSRRHLSARFSSEVGLPPKTFARMLRFRRAATVLTREGGARLGELALACGYADQAHFNRDFRAFAGTTPTQLVERLLPGGGGVAP